jgi:broad specificity phosphatase PhoE
VRHAESEGNAARIFQGQTEYPLSERGRLQARALGNWLSSQAVALNALYCSPLSRAAETARIIARELGAPEPQDEQDIIEYHSGVTEGLSVSQIEEQYPEFYARPLAQRGCMADYGGESLEDVRERLLRFREKLLALYRGGESVLAVMHGGSLWQSLHLWCGYPPPRTYLMRIGNCTCFKLALREFPDHVGAELQWMVPLELYAPELVTP